MFAAGGVVQRLYHVEFGPQYRRWLLWAVLAVGAQQLQVVLTVLFILINVAAVLTVVSMLYYLRKALPEIRRIVQTDVAAAYAGDPAARRAYDDVLRITAFAVGEPATAGLAKAHEAMSPRAA